MKKAVPNKASPRASGSRPRRGGVPEWAAPAILVDATVAPDVVTVPARLAIAIDGKGAPGNEAFTQSLGALYGIAYTLKFARKKSGRGTPFRVAPLEGVWAAEGCEAEGAVPPPECWTWRLRITVPSDVTAAEVADTIHAATTKKGGKLDGSEVAKRVFLEEIPEQRCGRILHVGAYADEPRSFAAMEPAMAATGLMAARQHVEIYLGNPQLSAPEKLKTVLLKELY
jgi:hypothetical protein